MLKLKKVPSYRKLVKKLDTIFSIYIRTLYADEDGMVACFTCHDRKPIKKMQNGHFESRYHLNIRWSDINCHPQCYRCNIILKGNYIVYTKEMIKKYGMETLDRLDRLRHVSVKLTTVDLMRRIEYTKALIKDTQRHREVQK